MNAPPLTEALMTELDRQAHSTVVRERGRLANFIRQRVADTAEAEDILQDVLFAFVEALRLPEPIEQAGAWLFRAARNRIIDRYRRKSTQAEVSFDALFAAVSCDEVEASWLEEVIPSAEAGPEAAYAGKLMQQAIESALAELPAEQRAVFIAHELEGQSFKQQAEASGIPLNTLLARKHSAVRHLRARLQALYDEFDS